MKSMKSTLLLAMVAAGFAAVGTASASVVDIQFLVTGVTNTATSFSASQGAYTGDGLTTPTWNVLSVANNANAGSATNLVASDGTTTTEAVSFTMTAGYVSTAYTGNGTAIGYGGGTNDLFQSYILSNPASGTPTGTPGTGTVTLSGLADGGSYQLYLYSGSGAYNNAATNFAITTGSGTVATGSNVGVANKYDGNYGFTENTNYVVFNATADSTGALAISYTGLSHNGGYEADINGLQVISTTAVPEPAALGLTAAGALGLLLLKRRHRA